MAPKLRITSLLVLVIVFLFGGNSHVVDGFQASLQLYLSTTPSGEFLNFEHKQPNLEAYRELLPQVRLVCGTGNWQAYNDIDYINPETRFAFGSTNSSTSACDFFPMEQARIRSFRYLGSSDPSSVSLSLYQGLYYTGNETLVEGRVLVGITSKIASISSTGGSAWTLFEGEQLDGNSYCLPGPSQTSVYYVFESYIRAEWNLTTIGSVFKGCDIAEIKEYRRNNNFM